MREPTARQREVAVREGLTAISPEIACNLPEGELVDYLTRQKWNKTLESSYHYDARTGKVRIPRLGAELGRAAWLRTQHLLHISSAVSPHETHAGAKEFESSFVRSLRQQQPDYRRSYRAQLAVASLEETEHLALRDDTRASGKIIDSVWRTSLAVDDVVADELFVVRLSGEYEKYSERDIAGVLAQKLSWFSQDNSQANSTNVVS